MAGSLNKVTLIGHVGQDPEIRQTNNGKSIVSFSLATSESWKDKTTGEKRENTEWHRIVVFNDALAGIVEQCVTKGSKLYVEGAIRTRKWQDQQGNDKYSTEITLQGFNGRIILLDSRKDGESNGGQAKSTKTKQEKPARPEIDDLDDQIPF